MQKYCFTFHQPEQDKLIINALVDHTSYVLELVKNMYLDFDEIKNSLLFTDYKLVQRTTEILKLQIVATVFQFKNIQNITLNTLIQTIAEFNSIITELTNKLKEKTTRNDFLEEFIKEMREDLDLMVAQLDNLKQIKEQIKQQKMRMIKKTSTQWGLKLKEKRLKMVEIEQKHKLLLGKFQKIETESLKQVDEEMYLKMQQEKFLNLSEMQLRKIQEDKRLLLQQEAAGQKHFPQQIKAQNSQYRFSTTLKHQQISLKNHNTKAKARFGLALVEGGVFEKGSSIRFRVRSAGHNGMVGVGFGIRNLIAGNGYVILNSDKIGHGCFLLMSGGRSYSHSDKGNNSVDKDFKYGVGDVIAVQRDGDEFLWRNVSSQKEQKIMVKLTGEEWGQVCFCLYLFKASVQIVN